MPSYNIQAGLSQLPNSQEEKEYNLLQPIYVALNNLAQKVSAATGLVDFNQLELSKRSPFASLLSQNHNKIYAKNVSGVTLGFGKIVNLFLSGSDLAARLADATTANFPAHGIVNTPLGLPNGEWGEIVVFNGYVLGITGTTVGTYYYLSTAGNVSSVRPSVSGSIIQACGFGLGSQGFALNVSSLFIVNP